MSSTTFANGTLIETEWLNDVNNRSFNGYSHATLLNAAGDGTTDDYTILNDGITAAALLGVVFELDGTKTYSLNTAAWTLPANTKLRTNGATLKCPFTTTGNTVWLTINNNVEIDELKISVPTGVQRDRVVLITGGHVRIGKITITSVDVQANSEANDSALRIVDADDVVIDRVDITNYDRAILFDGATHVSIPNGVIISGYVRGLYMVDSNNISIGASHVHTASVNASNSAGHNGVLISCDTAGESYNISLIDFLIEDAGEHGIRIGGPETQVDISIVRPVILRAGASGIKILGTDSGTPVNRNKRIKIIEPVIIDAGADTVSVGYNGIFISHCNDSLIQAPYIGKDTLTYSGYYGIRIFATDDLHINDPRINNTQNAGIILDGSPTDGDIVRLQINGGICFSCNIGIQIQTSGNDIRRFNINNLVLDSSTTYGFVIDETGGTFTQSVLRVRTQDNGTAVGTCNTNTPRLHIEEVSPSAAPTLSCANGSTWLNNLGLYVRQAGVWNLMS